MTVPGIIDGGHVTGLDVALGFEALVVGGSAVVTDLRADSPVDVTGEYARVAGGSSTGWTISGDRNRVDGCIGPFEFTGDGNTATGCTARYPWTDTSGASLILSGNRNRWLAGDVYYDGSHIGSTVLVDAGAGNALVDTDVVGAADGEPVISIEGTATETRYDRVLIDPGGASPSALVAAANGTTLPSETKEWGFGGVVVTGTSVILRAWRDLHLLRVVFTLRVAGSSDTEGDVLVNGVSAASFTISAAATSHAVFVGLDLSLDDEVSIDITTAGTLAQDLSTQAEVLR